MLLYGIFRQAQRTTANADSIEATELTAGLEGFYECDSGNDCHCSKNVFKSRVQDEVVRPKCLVVACH